MEVHITLSGVLIGLGMAIIGIAGVKWTFQIVNFTGPQGWLEHYTGSGTTYGVLKLASVVLILLGILVATGLGVPFLMWLLSPLRKLFTPPQS